MNTPSHNPKGPASTPKLPENTEAEAKLKLVWNTRHRAVAIVAGVQLGLAVLLGGPTFIASFADSKVTSNLKEKDLNWDTGQYLRPDIAEKTHHDRIRAVRIDGSYVSQKNEKGERGEGDYCFLKDEVADAVEYCDALVSQETGTHMQINYCFRSNELQSKICGAKGGEGCAGPGKSFHGSAQAIDINNYKPYESCLIDQGLMGGCATTIKDDPGHFSIGEIKGESVFNAVQNCGFRAGAGALFRKWWLKD
jgi:hypothetical protein